MGTSAGTSAGTERGHDSSAGTSAGGQGRGNEHGDGRGHGLAQQRRAEALTHDTKLRRNVNQSHAYLLDRDRLLQHPTQSITSNFHKAHSDHVVALEFVIATHSSQRPRARKFDGVCPVCKKSGAVRIDSR